MSKATFGRHGNERQSQLCLKYAAELRDQQGALPTPSAITRYCIERDLFSDEQLENFRFDGARRQVKQWLKTADEKGLPIWGQIPFTDANGEMFWKPRREMLITDYAHNYILRDDVINRNIIIRDRWRTEAVKRFGDEAFDAEVDRLRADREDDEDVA